MEKVIDAGSARVVATGLKFPEGPIAVDDGTVLVVEIEGGTLRRVHPDTGTVELVGDCGGGPNGSAFGPDGAVYVCNDGGLAFQTDEHGVRFPYDAPATNEGGTLQRVDTATGKVETVFTHCDGTRVGVLNDIVFDTTGWCYIVDTTNGWLLYSDPIAGTVRAAETGLEMPNGAGLSPDGSTLYASETFSGKIIAWDVEGPGKLANKRVHYSSEGAHGWDGLAVDGAGNVCAADLSESGITVIAPDGTRAGKFTTPTRDTGVTNVCFGGPDGRTAYVCSAGRGLLYAVPWPWPGLRLNFAH